MIWNATTVAPKASLASRTPTAAPATPAYSAIGPVNAMAQNPLTVDQMNTTALTSDPTLGSRTVIPAMTGMRDAPIVASVAKLGQGVPAFLQSSIASLNAEQALRRSAQSELLSRIMQGASTNGPDQYLWQEALRAASVSPGAHVNFGAAITDPRTGTAQFNAAEAYKAKTQSEVQALNAARAAGANLVKLQQQRGALGSAPFGTYHGSPQERLDQQIMDATLNAQSGSSIQQLGRASARPGPAMPQF